MDEKDNLRMIAGGNTPNPSREALEKMRADMEILVGLLEINAQLIRAKYDALIGQKFTEAQALELCKGSIF